MGENLRLFDTKIDRFKNNSAVGGTENLKTWKQAKTQLRCRLNIAHIGKKADLFPDTILGGQILEQDGWNDWRILLGIQDPSALKGEKKT